MGLPMAREARSLGRYESGVPRQGAGSSLRSVLGGLILLFALAACQVQFVSSYDETTDTLAKELQTRIDRQFQSWIRMPAGSPGLRYDDKANRDFYAGVSADLSVLQSRAMAQPLNQQTIGMLEEVRASIDKIEAFHKEHQTVSAAALGIAQRTIDFDFQRIIAWELAKKRGETPKGPGAGKS